ncbi:spondin domain-containing protein [Aureitalea marina]|uniref:Spondin domain-containing protein n=1 Tax=Aureitalea marina TaxID=930804 RepID=A0A2S7KMT5_9FLAO|nr:spondin domain-containing protein [Aureitalea marina]PQB03937.1 hypothetical protein BST85_02705 [Aureitalea marina]
MKRSLLLSLFALTAYLSDAQTAAEYTVTFTSNWSQAAHPHSSGNLPGGAHWSRLVGATHNDGGLFLEMGGLATPGIEDIAELGNNTLFFEEVDDAIQAGWADKSINGPDLDTSLGQMQIDDLVVSSDFPLLTLASMIAPSPDWMIAVNGISLLDEQGDWVDQIEINLYAYDAGTDSGPDYTSPNMNTDPAEPISSLQAVVPFSNEKIGTLTVSLNTILDLDDTQTKAVRLYPNPVTDVLRISGSNIREVEIYNALGSLIRSVRADNAEQVISMEDDPAGLYLVRLTTNDNRVSTHKIIKQ